MNNMKLNFTTFSQAILNYIKDASHNIKDRKVLDIGCGTGYYTRYFGKQNNVTGIDLQSCVQKKYHNFRFKRADATALPFKAGTFDVAVSFDVIEHIERDREMVAEAYRVLKNGGQLILGTPNRDRLIHLLLKLIGRPVQYPLYIGSYDDLGEMIHVREYTATELKDILIAAGFKHVEVFPYWLGITILEFGFVKVAKFLEQYCQYLFVRGYK